MILADVTAPRVLLSGAPATYATNAEATVSFDTVVSGVKYDAVVIEAYLPAASATNASAKWVILRVDHSDDGSTWTADTGNVGTTGTPSTSQFQIATAHNDTSNRQVSILNFDGRGKGSKLRLAFTPTPASNNTVQILAKGYRANVVPNNTTEMGVSNYGLSNG